MRLALVISSLAMGGAERVITHLATGWANLGIDVHLITLANHDSDFYTLPSSVHRICLNHMKDSNTPVQAVHNNINRIKALRKQFKLLKPQAVVSFMDATNVLVVLANMGLGIATIISERTNPGKYQRHLGLIWDKLRRATYPKATAVVAVSKETANQLAEMIPQGLVEVIPNPVFCYDHEDVSALGSETRTLVSMGRLVSIKNFDLLIKAFAKCLVLYPEWRLLIMGEGPQRKKLESLIKDLDLVENIQLLGAVKEPAKILAKSDIFSLCSSFEGFSNSLVEAMACGLPVVCTREAGGEIVKNGEQGYLVSEGHLDELTDALIYLMNNQTVREQMGRSAQQSAKTYFLPDVLNQWNQLLTQVTGMIWPIVG